MDVDMDLPRAWLDTGMVLVAGAPIAARLHRHHAVQLVRALRQPVKLVIENQTQFVFQGLIAANVKHSLDSLGAPVVIALVDPHGQLGLSLEALARSKAGHDFGSEQSMVGMGTGDWAQLKQAAFSGLPHIEVRGGHPVSAPVQRAVDYVDRTLDGRPRLTEAASYSRLSAVRLTHRFTSEVGLPFRRYVLWKRLERVARCTASGATLTEAAIESGFSDSAHLSRVFRTTFGLTPSAILPFLEVSQATATFK